MTNQPSADGAGKVRSTVNDEDPIAAPAHRAHEWIAAVRDELGVPDRQTAYQALRSTLHALRDRLPTDPAAHLGAQLPMVIRGVYYEGWRPAAQHDDRRSIEAFLDQVADGITRPPDTPDAIASKVLRVVARNVSAGEIADIRNTLPSEIRALIPEAASSANRRR